MSEPLITIGLTCYNAAATVERAVDSCRSQDWPNFEIIIVDDFSTDETVSIATAAISHDKRARLLRHQMNLGPAAARNTILREAAGEFVAFFDDDDQSLPERLSEQFRALKSYEKRTGEKLVACFAAGSRWYESGYVKQLPAIGAGGVRAPHGSDVADWLLFYRRNPRWNYGSGTPTCSLMARRDTFDAVGGFDSSFRRAEDADFAIRLAMAGGHFIGTTKPVLKQYATCAPDKSPEANLDAELRLARKYANYLRSVNRCYYAARWPRLRYWYFRRRLDLVAYEFLLLFSRHPVAASKHILATGIRRLAHDRNMRRQIYE